MGMSMITTMGTGTIMITNTRMITMTMTRRSRLSGLC